MQFYYQTAFLENNRIIAKHARKSTKITAIEMQEKIAQKQKHNQNIFISIVAAQKQPT